jgi:acetoin utilization deacetylase AcuC-like enzyme
MTVGVIRHPNCSLHHMGDFHPESPARLAAINEHLISSGLVKTTRQFEAIKIDPVLLSLVHTQTYIDYIFTHSPVSGEFRLDPDTSMNPYTLEAALLAAGAGVQAVDLIMSGELSSAFCAMRPPGHHAESDRAMGFCLFNTVAIAAAYSLQKYGLKKVAILDFDVHHGNGTEQIFTSRSDVLVCSTFQHPLYPFSGYQASATNIINTPLAPGVAGKEFRQAINQHWLPALDEFSPEMIFISAGFDAHAEDDISQINLVESDYCWVTEQIKSYANKHCNGRIVSNLEGGYALDALGRCVVSHLEALADH